MNIDELQKLVSSQNRVLFQQELEKSIKNVTQEKNPDASIQNPKLDSLILVLQQGQSLLPRYTYEAYLRTLESAKIVIPVPKPTFKFTKKNNAIVAPVESNISDEIINSQTVWQLKQVNGGYHEVISDGTRIGVTEITDSKVRIINETPAMCMTNLKNSIIIAPNVTGSVHITECSNCTIVLRCKQLRIHKTTDTNFYISVSSSPIIEHSSRVQFAPLVSESSGPWDQIKDFQWLRSEKSPNWSLIPEEERKIPE